MRWQCALAPDVWEQKFCRDWPKGVNDRGRIFVAQDCENHDSTIGTELFPPRLRENSRASRIVRAIDDYCFIPELKTCWPLNRLETASNRII